MSVEITRELIANRLGRVKYDRFLFYLMGPYKSFNLNYVLSEEDRREIALEELPSPLRRLFRNKDDINEAQALLRRVQGELRANPGVNAFLALDVDVASQLPRARWRGACQWPRPLTQLGGLVYPVNSASVALT